MSSDDVGSQLWIINPTNGRWGNKFTWDILVEPLEETNPAEIDLVYSRDHSNMRTIRLWPGTNKPVVSTGSHDDIAPFIYRIEGTIQCEGRTRTLKTTNGNIPNMKPDTPQYRIERSTQPENRVVGDIVGSKTYCSAGFLSYSGSMKITHTASAGVDIEKMAVTLGIAVEETIPLTLVPNYPVPEGWRGWLYKVAVTQYWDLYRRHYDWKGDPGPEALDGIIYKHYTDLFPEKEINPECGGN
ncbi:MAG: hypothetical protein QNK37_10085 [Acidobacteriota bacterium]|nr:hypothetical protein [Acidobacteriota bacterium]